MLNFNLDKIMARKVIKVRVSAGAKTEKIEEMADGVLKVRVQEPPERGKANARVLELIAKHFGVPRLNVTLQSGATYREKIISVDL